MSTLHAQEVRYLNGVERGVVKVKFKPTMAQTLSQIQTGKKTKSLSIGNTAFDQVAKGMKATRMKRLFPFDPNPKFEAKLQKHGLHLWYEIAIDENIDPKIAAAQFLNLPDVSKAECRREIALQPHNFTPYTPSQTPSTKSAMPFNDQMLPNQWHYQNTGQEGYMGGSDINLFKAWEQLPLKGRKDIIIAVMDNGVDVFHEDLRDNIWVNDKEIDKNDRDDDGNTYVDDVNGFDFVENRGANMGSYDHGTHVAGTIAAVNNNKIGVSGIAGGTGKGDGVKIMSLRIIGPKTSESADYSLSYIYAAKMGAVISQNSWGYTGEPDYKEDALLEAIDFFIEEAGDYPGSPMKGGIVIFAAGNEGKEGMYWPGCYDKVLSVGAIGSKWDKATYSNYGNWVDVSAPGGDRVAYGWRNQVLSTAKGDQYKYDNGTSMACPHVTGIAALAIANSPKQITNNELWLRIITGVKNIDATIPNYIDKLGTGAIDAELVTKRNSEIAPNKITNLEVVGMLQESAEVKWTIPSDEDDINPVAYNVYCSTASITNDNLNQAQKFYFTSKKVAGEELTFVIENLLGSKTYYFAVQAMDRWGNTSELSNIATGKTNNGPKINIDTEKVTITIPDASTNSKGSTNFNIINEDEGLLRWNYDVRTKYAALAKFNANFSQPSIILPNLPTSMSVGKDDKNIIPTAPFSSDDKYSMYKPSNKAYVSFDNLSGMNYIGEVNTAMTNSAATKFVVNDELGFNLTQLEFYLNYKAGTGNIIIQIYEGSFLSKSNIVFEQTYTSAIDIVKQKVAVSLNEFLYFKKGSDFTVVIHVPENNIYPLAVATELSNEYSDFCYYSSNMGKEWITLTSALSNSTKVWTISANSQYEYLDMFLALDPKTGAVLGNDRNLVTVNADALKVINGVYKANLIIKSNDPSTPEKRLEIELDVKGQNPKLVFPAIVEFGDIFIGDSYTIDIPLDNQGYGRLNTISYSIQGAAAASYSIVSKPSNILAREEQIIRVKFAPTATGNNNASIKITSGTYSYQIQLFGVGSKTADISVTPVFTANPGLTIGDNVVNYYTVQNTGEYPLKYFVPGFDNLGISASWPTKFHTYGYAIRSNNPAISNFSEPYAFTDISTTGTDITKHFASEKSYTLDLDFDFPYYNTVQQKIYIAKNGFITFDNSKNLNSVSSLVLGVNDNPSGIIGVAFYGFKYNLESPSARIYYKTEDDRVIIQYHNARVDTNDPNTEVIAQMVLFTNGNIKFYYDKMPSSASMRYYLSAGIEDVAKKDGIIARSVGGIDFTDGTVIAIDYPGPDIITSMKNASGIVAPGAQQTIEVNLSSAKLAEGTAKKYISIINNAPSNPRVIVESQLQVIAGGNYGLEASTNKVDFGLLFKNYPYEKILKIKNTGTKELIISSISTSPWFTVTGASSIKPATTATYTIVANTGALQNNVNESFDIALAHGAIVSTNVTMNIVEKPSITTSLTPPISKTLAFGTTSTIDYTINNSGGSNLDISINNSALWYNSLITTNKQIEKHGYATYAHNGDEPTYEWIDLIGKEGTVHYPYEPDNVDPNASWHKINNLPFPIKLMGIEYNSLTANYYGALSLTEHKPNLEGVVFSFPFDNDGAYILPFLCSGYFITGAAKDQKGIFYKIYDDKVVVSWERFMNKSGMGDDISFQTIIYADGTIKIQYKINGLGGVERVSNDAYVALQAPSKEIVWLSNHQYFNNGKGLAFLLTPTKTYTLAAGESVDAKLTFDATRTYRGTFNGTLDIASNDPDNKLFKLPLELTIPSVSSIQKPEVAFTDLGPKEVLKDQNDNFVEYERKFFIKNTGETAITINFAQMNPASPPNPILTARVFFEGSWKKIEEVFVPGRQFPRPTPRQAKITPRLLPGDSIGFYVSFTPRAVGEYAADFVIETNDATIGNVILPFKASSYNPPKANIDKAAQNVVLTLPADKEEREIAFNNVGGGYLLNYTAVIDYKRIAKPTTQTANAKTAKTTFDISALADVKAQTATTQTATAVNSSSYNRVLQYHTGNETTTAAYGNGSRIPKQKHATKYNAGPEGFNVSDVGTWFVPGGILLGKVDVEIWAGGTDIYNQQVIAKGSYSYSNESDDNIGKIINITLDSEVVIYPNEDFYVVFTYPINVLQPQQLGFNNFDASKAGRFWINAGQLENESEEDGEWVDALRIPGFASSGAFFWGYAAERTAKQSGWVKILGTNGSGTLQVGENDKFVLEFSAENALGGEQRANLVFRSNDTYNSVQTVPLSLNMNDAPLIIGGSTVTINEKENIEITFEVTDKEGHNITITTTSVPNIATATIDGTSIKLAFSTDYGDAGNYQATFRAVDEHGASRDLVIDITVVKTNRAPIAINPSEMQTWSFLVGETKEYNILDLFTDPDGDNLLYSINYVAGEGIITIYQTDDGLFIIKPEKEGTTTINFVVADVNAATATFTVNVIVSNCQSGIIVQKWNSTLIVNNKDGNYKDSGYQWYMNGLPIEGETKQYYSVGENNMLDFSASYHVKVTTNSDLVMYSCPLTPVKRGISLKAYPNPVDKGGDVTIVAQIPNLDKTPVTITVITTMGSIISTQVSTENITKVKMPSVPGIYLIKVSNEIIDETFRVIVNQ